VLLKSGITKAQMMDSKLNAIIKNIDSIIEHLDGYEVYKRRLEGLEENLKDRSSKDKIIFFIDFIDDFISDIHSKNREIAISITKESIPYLKKKLIEERINIQKRKEYMEKIASIYKNFITNDGKFNDGAFSERSADVLYQIKEYEKALSLYEKAKDIYEKNNKSERAKICGAKLYVVKAANSKDESERYKLYTVTANIYNELKEIRGGIREQGIGEIYRAYYFFYKGMALLCKTRYIDDKDMQKLFSDAFKCFKESIQWVGSAEIYVWFSILNRICSRDLEKIRRSELLKETENVIGEIEKKKIKKGFYIEIKKTLGEFREYLKNPDKLCEDTYPENMENNMEKVFGAFIDISPELIGIKKFIGNMIPRMLFCLVYNIQIKVKLVEVGVPKIKELEDDEYWSIEPRLDKVRIASTQLYMPSEYFTPIGGLHHIKKEHIGEIQKKILKILEDAIEKKANIICFPELCMAEDIMKDIQDHVDECDDVIVIAGSFYDHEKKNVCPVIVSNEEIMRVEKINPSPPEKSDYFEQEMKSGEGKITVFKTKFGYFTILICWDFMKDKLRGELLESNYLKDINFVFNPSRNSSVEEAQRYAADFCEKAAREGYNIYVIISNVTTGDKEKYGGTSIYRVRCKEKDVRKEEAYKLDDDADKREGYILVEFDRKRKFPWYLRGTEKSIKDVRFIPINDIIENANKK